MPKPPPFERTFVDDEQREPAAARLLIITSLGALRSRRWIDSSPRMLPASMLSATPAAQQHALAAQHDADLLARLTHA